MTTPLATCDDYKTFLRTVLEENKQIYGYRSLLAEAAKCQLSYLSQVLNGDRDLSFEQGFGVTEHLHLSAIDTEIFMTLLQEARAGTQTLRRYYLEKRKTLQSNYFNFSALYKEEQLTDEKIAAVYYSRWYYMAVHIVTSIPEYQLIPSIARKLDLPEELVSQTLDELKSFGFVDNSNGKYTCIHRELHLPNSSAFTLMNHANWRTAAIENAALKRSDDAHFTAVCSLSQSDFDELKTKIFEFINTFKTRVTSSKEENIACFNMDFFTF